MIYINGYDKGKTGKARVKNLMKYSEKSNRMYLNKLELVQEIMWNF